ncbi:alpha/beta fold hydrolase [Phenylobacterium sp. LH3H17]|uniref:alpha/beta hydrolase n=1 Tax=Phenylobacterium sp. LH3H17 TaxID=2903901 RepID=UPI0020C9DDDC|nr:alpha/beta fold hydrolase [Phenylobacterium sp. LH3H17]UTP38020.1 alpha/beta fold hydrolase [Phenylobacterium sp. LH3H17]
MRAESPVLSGRIDRDGVGVAYEVFGTSGQVLVLLPCWIIVPSRQWKAQVADLARDCRLVVIEGRGNGASDRPADPAAYASAEYVADALAVMDALALQDVVLMGFSMGGPLAALVAQARPHQVSAVILIAPVSSMTAEQRAAREAAFLAPLDAYEGWTKYNANYIRDRYEDFLTQFFGRMFLEPHSSKQIEDGIAWARETTPEVLVDSRLGALRDEADFAAAYASIGCPVLLMHGDADEIAPIGGGRRVAALARADLRELAGSGHGPHLRHPALVNAMIRDFLVRHDLLKAPKPAARGRRRDKRILYLSSPIGLGHARRDLAVAGALRELTPGLRIDWLSQDPVTRLLAKAGERVHPASHGLANESRHIEAEAGEHDLHVFEALRRMDEIQVRNFRVFQQAVEGGTYDLVVADEAWEVDHFWHEHPQFKRAPLVWMTDFVGFAPVPGGGPAEPELSTDYNAEMVGHVDTRPGVRDLAIFVGDASDVVDDTLGRDLPRRRAWVQDRFAFSGYILGDGVPRPEDKPELRARLGFRPDERVCVVTVGGSGVGQSLIRRILAAAPMARRRCPDLRFVVVAGPRLPPEAFPPVEGVECVGFVPDLPRMLAAAHVAVVQGGLSTTMELAASGTPFIYIPLARHFEQEVHVAHRLARYGAGRRLNWADADPDTLAEMVCSTLASPVLGIDVGRDGARRAARLIKDLW